MIDIPFKTPQAPVDRLHLGRAGADADEDADADSVDDSLRQLLVGTRSKTEERNLLLERSSHSAILGPAPPGPLLVLVLMLNPNNRLVPILLLNQYSPTLNIAFRDRTCSRSSHLLWKLFA